MSNMPESEFLLEYSGLFDQKTIELLLKKFRKEPAFINLDKKVGKRVYFILVECIENISRYIAKKPEEKAVMEAGISVRRDNGKIYIKSGNCINVEDAGELIRRLEQVNNLDDKELKSLFETTINKKIRQSDRGAGLGFMMIKQRSCDKIAYKFTSIDARHSYFEYVITVNE